MTYLSRRGFLQSLSLAGGAFLVPHGAFAAEKPNLRFGAFSDPHVGDGKDEFWFKRTVDIFSWYRDQNVDAVLCAAPFTTWFVPTKGMAAPIDHPSAHAPQFFEIARDRLPKGPLTVEVTPLDAFGNRGTTLSSSF